MKAPSKPRITRGAGWIKVAVAGADLPAFMGAAYQVTDASHAIVGRAGRAATVTLWPKNGTRTAGLAARFLAVYGDQRSRWSVERANLDVRAEVLRRSLRLIEDEGAAPGEPAPSLSADQKAEIARMLAEAESAPRDPLGIARPWEEGRDA
jgi:hypothetical protein